MMSVKASLYTSTQCLDELYLGNISVWVDCGCVAVPVKQKWKYAFSKYIHFQNPVV